MKNEVPAEWPSTYVHWPDWLKKAWNTKRVKTFGYQKNYLIAKNKNQALFIDAGDTLYQEIFSKKFKINKASGAWIGG